jgi:hypothetical protein
MSKPVAELTRVEVIDHRRNAPEPGRCFVHWDEASRIALVRQDQGRTLKIFITRPETTPTEQE